VGLGATDVGLWMDLIFLFCLFCCVIFVVLFLQKGWTLPWTGLVLLGGEWL